MHGKAFGARMPRCGSRSCTISWSVRLHAARSEVRWPPWTPLRGLSFTVQEATLGLYEHAIVQMNARYGNRRGLGECVRLSMTCPCARRDHRRDTGCHGIGLLRAPRVPVIVLTAEIAANLAAAVRRRAMDWPLMPRAPGRCRLQVGSNGCRCTAETALAEPAPVRRGCNS